MDVKKNAKRFKKARGQRFYTETSHRWMTKTRIAILILLSPIWFPLFALQWLMYQLSDLLESLLNGGDDLLQKFLDKFIPQKY